MQLALSQPHAHTDRTRPCRADESAANVVLRFSSLSLSLTLLIPLCACHFYDEEREVTAYFLEAAPESGCFSKTLQDSSCLFNLACLKVPLFRGFMSKTYIFA